LSPRYGGIDVGARRLDCALLAIDVGACRLDCVLLAIDVGARRLDCVLLDDADRWSTGARRAWMSSARWPAGVVKQRS
jgi:hypothetical protein